MASPWEKYVGKGSESLPEARGPWTRYKGSGQGSDAFQKAVQAVLAREGGLNDNPADRGGLTNFGISSRANPDVDVKHLTLDKAKSIYFERYWKPLGADQLPEDVRDMAFDSAVNHGVQWTKRVLAEVGNDVDKLFARRKKLYQTLASDSEDQKQFLEGWMNRLEGLKPKRPWLKYGGQG